jgi:hypothetical protein
MTGAVLANIGVGEAMAQIRVNERRGRYRITVRGPLRASDLRRLERACGLALEFAAPPLAILLDSCTDDPVAEAYLDRLRTRGAVVRLEATHRG